MGKKSKRVWLFLGLGLALLTLPLISPQVISAFATTQAATPQSPEQRPSQPVQSTVPPADAPMSVWMEKKLQYSQELLRLLAVGDMPELELTAQRMKLVGKVEGFVRSNSTTYKNHLRSFELANEELIRQAERENIEGATLAFHQLTSSCVACHVAIRQPAKPEKPNN